MECPYCGSEMVEWNWMRLGNVWIHECWDCNTQHSTPDKVVGGISYTTLVDNAKRD